MADSPGSRVERERSGRARSGKGRGGPGFRQQKDVGINIAVIGGGTRCQALLEMCDTDRFKHLRVQIVAVADINPEAPGLLLARQKGIFTTSDYHDFFQMENLDCVIELTGNEELLRDVIRNKPPQVQVVQYAISRLLSDMVTFRQEYKAQEQDLTYHQSMIQTLFAGIKEPGLWLRPDYRIVDANEAMLKFVGLSRDEVVGRTCYEVSHGSLEPCNSASCHCPMNETLQTGLSAHAIHEHRDRESQIRYVEVSTYPLRNYLGKVIMVFEFCRDITDEVETQLEQRTRQVKKDLARLVHEDKMIALGKLVASSVHEINNPIAGIHTLARLLLRTLEEGPPAAKDLDQFRQYLELIANESCRCGQIVSGLLSFSRQQKIERQRLDVNEVLRSAILLCRHRMELQHITLEEDLAPELPGMLGDYNQIQQCFLNLMFNAMEAMPEGGTLTITTSLEDKKNMLRVAVSDTGPGIAEKDLSLIFEPFFSTKSEDKGVGLGLSMVHGIVRQHQGTIYVDSKVGVGSTFVLRFPVAEEG